LRRRPDSPIDIIPLILEREIRNERDVTGFAHALLPECKGPSGDGLQAVAGVPTLGFELRNRNRVAGGGVLVADLIRGQLPKNISDFNLIDDPP
jgi:hypothetical protein